MHHATSRFVVPHLIPVKHLFILMLCNAIIIARFVGSSFGLENLEGTFLSVLTGNIFYADSTNFYLENLVGKKTIY